MLHTQNVMATASDATGGRGHERCTQPQSHLPERFFFISLKILSSERFRWPGNASGIYKEIPSHGVLKYPCASVTLF
jgi:hypothetical protein